MKHPFGKRQSAADSGAPPEKEKGSSAAHRAPGLEPLIDRLPKRLRGPIHWLRKPSSRWARIPAGVLLSVGGLFGMLPLLGFWMLPLGLLLLAEDIPPLKRGSVRVFSWLSGRASRKNVRSEGKPGEDGAGA